MRSLQPLIVAIFTFSGWLLAESGFQEPECIAEGQVGHVVYHRRQDSEAHRHAKQEEYVYKADFQVQRWLEDSEICKGENIQLLFRKVIYLGDNFGPTGQIVLPEESQFGQVRLRKPQDGIFRLVEPRGWSLFVEGLELD